MCLVVAALTGCSKTESPANADTKSAERTPADGAVATIAPIDACSLLTREEIEAVQGEAPQDAKASQQPAGGLMMYDCLFALPTFTNSISLSVAQSSSGGDRDPRKAWQETFAAANAKASEKSPPPQPVEGIGDEAFWTGNERIGALYVLKGSRYLRISVGGPGDSAAKIEKCRALAEAAMKRF